MVDDQIAMDVSAVGAVTSTLQAQTDQQAGETSVLKKTLDAEQAVAMELVQAIASHDLGQNINLNA